MMRIPAVVDSRILPGGIKSSIIDASFVAPPAFAAAGGSAAEAAMHLTLHTDYALRLLMYLALRPGRRCTIEEVAGAYGISRNHLMKVALTTAREGFVHSLSGRSGGLRLALVPDRRPQNRRVG